MTCVAYLPVVNGIVKDPRACPKDIHYCAEAAYQPRIPIAIFLKGLLPFLESLEDSLTRTWLFERGTRTLREVRSSYSGIVSQGIDEQLGG